MTRIWYTKGLSVTGDAIALMRADPAAAGWTFVASHTDPAAPVGALADIFLVEPKGQTGAAYAGWVLETAIAERVDLVVAQRSASALWDQRSSFAGHGIALEIAAEPGILALLDDKRAFQADIARPEVAAEGVRGHDAWQFATLPEFDAAWETARDTAGTFCVKPARGIFGAGFRRIDAGGDEMARILSTEPGAAFRISLAAYRAALAGAARAVPQLLMPFLPGVERSVDFVARNGVILSAVCRAKVGTAQRLETRGASVDMARVLAARYGLSGMCNLQTREDAGGVPRVLEINARMSGGMALACLAGVNLPLISAQAALGHDTGTHPAPQEGALVQFEQVARRLGG